MNTEDAIADRWRVALHEGAHFVVCRAYAPHVRHIAFVHTQEASFGWTSLPPHFTTFKTGAVAAAGAMGERLARVNPPPELPAMPTPKPPETAAQIRAAAVAALEAVVDRRRWAGTATDAELLARCATQFEPENPKDWPKRWRRMKAAARVLTWQRRAEILDAARILFLTGRIQYEPENDFCAHGVHGETTKKGYEK